MAAATPVIAHDVPSMNERMVDSVACSAVVPAETPNTKA